MVAAIIRQGICRKLQENRLIIRFMAKKIFVGLTTITPGEWRNKVKEIDELGLKEISLFPTNIDHESRRELYRLLEKTRLERIPHVHLRNDMTLPEIKYLIKRFKTKVFNIHSSLSIYPYTEECGKYAKIIYVENTGRLPTADDLKKFSGLCVDFSHWENNILEKGEKSEYSLRLITLADDYKIGCNHVSAVKSEIQVSHDSFSNMDFAGYDSHWLDNLKELDYVKKYADYLSDFISIELENPLTEQLEAKKYLEKILGLS